MIEKTKEESPYQIYYNVYCGDCDDELCIVKRKDAANKKMSIHGKKLVLPNDNVREAMWRCAKLRDLLKNYYMD